MLNSKIASRYAKALIDIATDNNQLAAIQADMQMIETTINNSRDLQLFLNSPIIKSDKKSTTLSQIFDNKVQSTTSQFIQLLVTKGRESNLSEIIDSFKTQMNELNKIKEVVVTTAVKMDDSVRNVVSQKAQLLAPGFTINISEKVNADIIGGFIIELDDMRYDASVKTELANIQKQFTI